MKNSDSDLPDLDIFSVLGNVDICFGNSVGSEHDLSASFGCDIVMPGNKVSVEVRFEDVRDLCLALFCQLEVERVVSHWVYYHGLSF